jgi:hypothetical protein
MKKQADKHRRDISYQVGDFVLVKLQPYRQQSVALRKNQKLGMRYFVPFEIIACVGKVAYKLKLPENAKIHPVFHVSQLKPFKGTTQDQYMPLPLTMSETGPIIQPIAVLQARTIQRGMQKIHQVQIQWDQTVEATWEDLDDLQNKFPTLNLEDKVVVKGESIVMKPSTTTSILEGNVSANSIEGPQNLHDGNSVAEIKEKIGPRRGTRVRKAHGRWKFSTKLWSFFLDVLHSIILSLGLKYYHGLSIGIILLFKPALA